MLLSFFSTTISKNISISLRQAVVKVHFLNAHVQENVHSLARLKCLLWLV